MTMIWFWLITIAVAVGYLAMTLITARIAWLTLNKKREWHATANEAFGVGLFWPFTLLILMPLIALFAESGRGGTRKRPIEAWITRPTRSERRAARLQRAEREQQKLLDQARAEGLPVDIFEP
jgi:hypothetical protein